MTVPRNHDTIYRMINRIIDLGKLVTPNKVVVLYGPRQVGKTTLLQDFLAKTSLKYKLENGDDIHIQKILGSQDIKLIKHYAQNYELLAIDEAQRIPNIGLGLKILVDHVPNIKIIATGSASFDLSYKIGEPLVGRAIPKTLYPIAQAELLEQFNEFELQQKLDEFLIYGSYPETFKYSSPNDKSDYLKRLVGSYLFKDILEIEKVKNSQILLDLLRLLAFQIGNEVSLSELGSALSLDRKTIARYLNLLEQSFIIINLRGYSQNLRSEITRKSKYYFLDNGVRNAVISNFNPLYSRDDVGKLWENFIVCERLKAQQYKPIYANNYFWRTWDQKEIDWIEERDGSLFGWEFKYSPTKKTIHKKAFLANYPKAHLDIVNRENYLDFVANFGKSL